MSARHTVSAQGLRETCAEAWEAAVRHRFVQEIAEDRLDDRVYRAYLLQDHLFIDALVRHVAHAVTVAPGMLEQRRLSTFLGVLTSEENDYFERSFDALGVTAATRAGATKDDTTLAFEDLFLAARAEGSYAAAIGALLPVEWVYLDWAGWVRRHGTPSKRFWIREWVDLHDGAAFASFVGWLGAEFDRHAPREPPAAQERIARRFAHAVQLEAAFFDAAYAAASIRPPVRPAPPTAKV